MFGGKKIFCPNSPNLPEKLLWNKRSPYKFHVAVNVGRLYFPLPKCHRHGNRKFGASNLFLNNPTKKSTLGCARTLSEAIWLGILEDLPHSLEVFH